MKNTQSSSQLHRSPWYIWAWRLWPLTAAWALSGVATILIVAGQMGEYMPHLDLGYKAGIGALMWLLTGTATIVLTSIVLRIASHRARLGRPWMAVLVSAAAGVVLVLFGLLTTLFSYTGHVSVVPLGMWLAWALVFHPVPSSQKPWPKVAIILILFLIAAVAGISIYNIASKVRANIEWSAECEDFVRERPAMLARLNAASDTDAPVIWRDLQYGLDNDEFSYLVLYEFVTGRQSQLPADSYDGWMIEMAMYRFRDQLEREANPAGGTFVINSDKEQWDAWLEIAGRSEFQDMIQNTTSRRSICRAGASASRVSADATSLNPYARDSGKN